MEIKKQLQSILSVAAALLSLILIPFLFTKPNPAVIITALVVIVLLFFGALFFLGTNRFAAITLAIPIALISTICVINSYTTQYFNSLLLAIPIVINTFVLSLIILLYIKNKDFYKREVVKNKLLILLFTVGLVFYSTFSFVSYINTELDLSEPEICNTEIKDKYYDVTHSKFDISYDFYVIADVSGNKNTEISVTYEQYRLLSVGDTINVYVKNGALGCPYYYYEDCRYTAELTMDYDSDKSFNKWIEKQKLRPDILSD